MRLATVVRREGADGPWAAVVDASSHEVVLLHRADAKLPRTMVPLLAGWDQGAAELTAQVVSSGRGRVHLDDVRLLAPVPRPPVVWAVARNYADHAAELSGEVAEFPSLFTKAPGCVIGPGAAIVVPDTPHEPFVDHEVEVAVVIGRRCHRVPASAARDVVAGYTVMNDVTERVWQKASPTMSLGKSFDTHGPLGPWIVTADELEDPHDLTLRCSVNDEVVQDGHSSQMVHDVWRLIEILSTACTLEPGTVISTGTPAGVGIARGVSLQPGDHVRCEVSGIGVLENPVVADPG